MKVIIAAEPLENGVGLATFVLDAVDLFARYRPNWEFTLLTLSNFRDATELSKHSNVQVILCDQLGWRGKIVKMLPHFRGRERLFNTLAVWLPFKALRKQFGNLKEIWDGLGHYDVVWVPYFAISKNHWPALYKQGTVKAPIVLNIFDLHTAVFPEEWKPYPVMVDNFWNRFKSFARQVPAIITHSQFQKNAIIEHFGVLPEKITVLYMPLPDDNNLKQHYHKREVALVEQQLGVKEPFVFSPMSQGTSHKNHLRLIRAWALVKKAMGDRCPQLVFTARGSKEQYRKFKQEVQNLDLANLVVFTGTIDRRPMGMLYQHCIAVISPTLYESSCGLPILEALSLGKQIAGSDIPPIKEQMEHFHTTINYFDPLNEHHMAKVIVGMLQQKPKLCHNAPANIKDIDQEARTLFIDGYLQQFQKVIATFK